MSIANPDPVFPLIRLLDTLLGGAIAIGFGFGFGFILWPDNRRSRTASNDAAARAD